MATPRTHRITLPGWFDLDDLSTHISQNLTAEGSGYQRAELQHPQIRQRAVREFNRSIHDSPKIPSITREMYTISRVETTAR
jgi:hypothetical protein